MAISDLTPQVQPALWRRVSAGTARPIVLPPPRPLVSSRPQPPRPQPPRPEAPRAHTGPRRGRPVRRLLAGFGPAVVAAIAYVDPGNFATNIAAGSRKRYLLVWVVVAANLIAVLVQNLSAKLGLATGKSLPTLCREQMRPAVARLLWLQAEAVTIATDLAEVVGGAVALNLLFGLPLVQGALVTSVVAFGLMALQSRGAGRFELVVGGLFAVVLLGFLLNLVSARPDAGGLAAGMIPRLDGADSLLLAIGILGATVMPHAVYLHSALTASTVHTASTAPRHTRATCGASCVVTGQGSPSPWAWRDW